MKEQEKGIWRGGMLAVSLLLATWRLETDLRVLKDEMG